MKTKPLLLPLVISLVLFSCREEQNQEEIRIRQEVEQRVDVLRDEMKVAENRWRTARVITFCLLAGGALIWLFNGGGSPPRAAYPLFPDNRNPDPGHRRRVIDRIYDDDESDEHPYRR